jgi:hypothetical protein
VQKTAGLPVSIELPSGAETKVDLATVQPSQTPDSRTWAVPFTYTGGWDAAIGELEKQLKAEGFERLEGPGMSQEANFGAGTVKPSSSAAKRVWISADRRTIIFLNFSYRRAGNGRPETNDYVMSVLQYDDPYLLKEPHKAVEIK